MVVGSLGVNLENYQLLTYRQERNEEVRYQDLIVWKKSMDLVDAVYAVSSKFPKEERYGLWGQITRSAVSVPSNIAEGSGRATAKECVRFFSIARGSLYELMTQLLIAERRDYCRISDELKSLANEVAKMLTRMISRKI